MNKHYECYNPDLRKISHCDVRMLQSAVKCILPTRDLIPVPT